MPPPAPQIDGITTKCLIYQCTGKTGGESMSSTINFHNLFHILHPFGSIQDVDPCVKTIYAHLQNCDKTIYAQSSRKPTGRWIYASGASKLEYRTSFTF